MNWRPDRQFFRHQALAGPILLRSFRADALFRKLAYASENVAFAALPALAHLRGVVTTNWPFGRLAESEITPVPDPGRYHSADFSPSTACRRTPMIEEPARQLDPSRMDIVASIQHTRGHTARQLGEFTTFYRRLPARRHLYAQARMVEQKQTCSPACP